MINILYDVNGFVWDTSDVSVNLQPRNGLTLTQVNYAYPDEDMFDSVYGLPLHKYVNGVMSDITNPDDYNKDPILAERYNLKLHDEVKELLKTKTLAELKTIYNSSPPAKKKAIYDEIEIKWDNKLYTKDKLLSLEVMCRAIAEYFYIKEVEKRALTTEEQTAFNNMMTTIREHNSLMIMDGKSPILNTGGWYHLFLHGMLQKSDELRAGCIPERIYVCGV